MAITKLMNIKDTGTSDHAGHLNRLLTYMMNPEKTQEEAKVGAVNCIPESASITMQQTKDSFGKVTGRQGYHFVISFKPGETDADTAYKIAEEFISEYLSDKYETVFAVHDDKEHIHIHIAFNSVSFVDGYKYHYANNDWAKIIQPIVNRLTSKEGLSTVELDPNEKHDRYKDHNTYRDGADNFSDMIKRDIDVAIAEAYSYDEFLQIMKDRGYEIKEGKYLAFRGKEMSRFRRCKKETLGIDYTEEAIRNRIPYESLNTFRAETEEEAQKIVYSKIPRGKRAKLSPVQKKYFARLYRLKLIQRRPYSKAWQFRDEIKKMHKLEEQYLFLVEHDITSLDHLKEVKSDLDSERRKVAGAKSKNYRTVKKLRELYQVASEMSNLIPGERLFQSGDKEFETEHRKYSELNDVLKKEGYTYEEIMRLKEHYHSEELLLKEMSKKTSRDVRIAVSIIKELEEEMIRNPEVDKDTPEKEPEKKIEEKKLIRQPKIR